MNTALAVAVGYLFGAKLAKQDLDRLGRAVQALVATEEFSDVVTAARAQVASSLRDLATLVDSTAVSDKGGDLVAQVRRLVGEDR